MPEFVVKDSGVREEYSTGMVRDTQEGKARFSLMRPVGVPYDEQFLTRCAMHLMRGAKKYGDRNWEKAHTPEELERFKDSAERHLNQWLAGDADEDHAAAVFFNLLAAETCRYRMRMIEQGISTNPDYGAFTLVPGPGWELSTLANRPDDVPYHGHSHENIDQVRVDARDEWHLKLPPHDHQGTAVVAHDYSKGLDSLGHTIHK